jgi:hypothetical protein
MAAESSCPCCQQQLPFELLPDKRRLGAVCAHTNLAAEAAAAAGTAEGESILQIISADIYRNVLKDTFTIITVIDHVQINVST